MPLTTCTGGIHLKPIQECLGILTARCASCNCMTYFYYAPITFILVSRVTNLCFTLFNVSRETYYICKSSGWYIREKGLFQTLVVFRFIVSIVLYQKLSSESRRDEFNFDIIIYDLTLNWNEYAYLHFFSMFHVKHSYI